MGRQIEIAIAKTVNGITSLKSADIGNPTRAHYDPIMTRLDLDSADDWTAVNPFLFMTLDPDQLNLVEDLPDHVTDAIAELQAFVKVEGCTFTTFARLA
jgi:hypothetical protein